MGGSRFHRGFRHQCKQRHAFSACTAGSMAGAMGRIRTINLPKRSTAKPGDLINFEVPVDDTSRCTEFKPFKMAFGVVPYPHCGRRTSTSPHMRAFWAATLAFMSAFVGWFAFAPLLVYVRKDIGICDNADQVKLDVEKVKCICKKSCKATITNANICAVSFDILTRFLLGSVIKKIGPARTDIVLLLWGSVMVGCSALVMNGPGLIAVRFFVSALGSTFVVNQFWNSIMFNRGVVGTANATAGGWGNLGGGITQTLMPLFYKLWHDGFGMSLSMSWRLAMMFPATFYLFLASWIFFCTQDMPQHSGRFDVAMLGKSTKAGIGTYLNCLKDYRVFLMIMQYGACFGIELVMNTILALHFTDNFGVKPVIAGAMAKWAKCKSECVHVRYLAPSLINSFFTPTFRETAYSLLRVFQ